jgi:TfoX/Sxy family transcriptional regulator of competence genes
MAYDEGLAERVRDALAEVGEITEKKMFGGVAFMLSGNMCVGIVKDDLMIRVGPHEHDELVGRPHARPMDFTGRTMKGFLYVAPEGVEDDSDLAEWVQHGLAFAGSLPPK